MLNKAREFLKGKKAYITAAIGILSDPRQALAGPRRYVYLPVWQSASLPEHHGHRAPTGRYTAQRLVFSPETAGYRQAFHFRMADGRRGEKLEGVLRFRLYAALSTDGFAVDINGVPVHSSRLRITHLPQGEPFDTPRDGLCLPGAGFIWPPHLRVEIALADCPAFRGDNELGIRLKGLSPARTANPVMEALEVLVAG